MTSTVIAADMLAKMAHAMSFLQAKINLYMSHILANCPGRDRLSPFCVNCPVSVMSQDHSVRLAKCYKVEL